MLYKELYDIIVSLREQLRLSIIDAAQNEAEANDLRAEVERLLPFKELADGTEPLIRLAKNRIQQLEEAVEWVRPLLTTDDQRKELRRRAGKEG